MPSNFSNTSAVWWQRKFSMPFSTYMFVHPAICFIGVCGTLLLLVALIAQRKATKLSVATHSFFTLLLTADTTFLVIVFISAVYRLSNDGRNISNANTFLCFTRPILQQTALVTQSYLQCVMSVHRILAISSPLWTRRMLTDRRLIGILALSVLFVATTQTGLVFSVTNFETIDNRTRCFISAASLNSVKFRYFPITIECIIPSCVLIASTILIVVALIRRYRKSMIQSSRDVSDEIRLGVVLLVIDIIYLISTVPVSVMSRTMSINFKDYETQEDYIAAMDRRRSVNMLRVLAPATDWIVLLCLGNQIRVVFMETVTCGKCKKTEENQLADSTRQSV